ncbi:GTP-binding protein rho1 [Cokeromyces recurvatus]|uniref:GTP-binding protein rho1 n=1 Tax=Cokeromyces recurvatus TaxID=90255 RepID=UPI00221E6A5B|nr:GTP-binding protein rho1 [Cokeromyces recurvatus]KAI7904809.1 GTP-binding protein rho1 [Cokeromyces recurvatus]
MVTSDNSVIKRAKLVIVGDGACGKTCLLIVYAGDRFPETYIPTVFSSSLTEINVDGNKLELALWDTAGQEDYDRIRPLSYYNTHVILLCFSVDSHDSLDNVQEKWIEELTSYCYRVPIILVACKIDLRDDENTIKDLNQISRKPITYDEGLKAANNIKADNYMECSAKLNQGVQEVFNKAARYAYDYISQFKAKKKKLKCICL